MEGARTLPSRWKHEQGRVLDQFSNADNPVPITPARVGIRRYSGRSDAFVCSMGTTGTIMGVSRYLKEQNADAQIVGLQLKDGSRFLASGVGLRLICSASSTGSWSMADIDQSTQNGP